MENTSASAVKAAIENKGRPGKICFVCTGNTCRSPMAEAVFRKLYSSGDFFINISGMYPPGNIPFSDIEACSAGLFPTEGQKISDNAILALENRGIIAESDRGIYEHRAKRLTKRMLSESDKIVCMTSSHAFSAIQSFPAYASKIFSFPRDVADPFGGDLDEFLACLDDIIALEKEFFAL